MSQQSFISIVHASPKKSRKRKFLETMNAVIPWEKLVETIQEYFPPKHRGRKRTSLELLLKCICLQQWYNLSDPGLEEEVNETLAFQWFLNIDIFEGSSVDETTICKFRHTLEKNRAFEKIFKTINEHIHAQGYIMSEGTITDATLIRASSSTKNKEQRRDPEMSSTKKGNQYHFGMKSHIGVDTDHGLVHTVVATTAKCHDKKVHDQLLHGREKAIFGDKAYYSQKDKQKYRQSGVFYGVTNAAKRNRTLTSKQKVFNRNVQQIRSKVEHVFGVVKNLWGYRSVRYKGIYKNECQQYLLYGLANIYKVRWKLRERTG